MMPFVQVHISFEPHRDDVGELYESLRSLVEQVRPFNVVRYEFDVTMRKDIDDDQLPAF